MRDASTDPAKASGPGRATPDTTVLLAALATPADHGRATGGSGLIQATKLALVLQTAILSLAIGLPLRFGDLGLAVLGALLTAA